ncbi:hypothetical protein JR316_0000451 [Psilocybe cubensis]|uniref:Uncharacterized protein n=2 Tax=Psilocybe cubensis TaxID=181762 RepID=A0ACB8HFF5_PSICU|nr:hypothetical protein JR316_0000451 [Psilocybe cubensis]KAH9486387.1 hypothetical protein JR316_0000451 [Psilocybe cubensis]
MPVDQFFPLERNPLTQEPFLRLRQHKNVIMTPMRWDDAPHIAALLNDPRVYKWLMYTPYPYTHEDGEEWIQLTKPKLDAILQELQIAQGQDELKIVGGAPICSIREIQEDGTDKYIGSLDIIRCLEVALLDVDTKEAQQKADRNKILGKGDPDIIWSFGDYLAPSHHGQGIMTDAINTLLHDWAIPRMNVHRIICSAFLGNRGSVRVFEKNGFVMTRTIQEHAVVRGELRGSHILEWTMEESKKS